MSVKPLVSVVMTTYNGEAFLRDQLDSILSQTYPIYEIIISDDGSVDNTWSILSEYQSVYPIIKLFRNARDMGPNKNFVKAFLYASGDYIAPCDQDDIWYSNKIEVLVGAMNDRIDVVYAQDLIMYEDGRTEPQPMYILPLDMTIWKNRLKGHTSLFRRDILYLYNHNSYLGADCSWDYVLALYGCITNRILALSNTLMIWRRHINAVTIGSKNQEKKRRKEYKFLFCNVMLFKKSKGFSTSFHSYLLARVNLIDYLLENQTMMNDKALVLNYRKVLFFAAQQTIFSMFKSGFYNVKGHIKEDKYRIMSLRKKIGYVLWAFCVPYVEWYETRKHKYLS